MPFQNFFKISCFQKLVSVKWPVKIFVYVKQLKSQLLIPRHFRLLEILLFVVCSEYFQFVNGSL